MTDCMIVPLKSPGKVLGLDGGSTNNGTSIVVQDRLTSCDANFNNQVWLRDGYKFRSRKDASKVIQLAGGSTSNGTYIQLWTQSSGSTMDADIRSQEWSIVGRNIVSKVDTSMCWHLENGNVTNNTKVQIWNEKDNEDGVWNVEWFNRGRCMIVPCVCPWKTVQLQDGKTAYGTPILVSDRIRYDHKNLEEFENQLWEWDGSTFRFSKDPTKCISLQNGSTEIGANLVLGNTDDCECDSSHQFTLDQGNILVRKMSSNCWYVPINGVADLGKDNELQIWNRRNDDKSFWTFEMYKEDFDLVDPNYKGLCLIVPLKYPGKNFQLQDGKTDNGTLIVLYDMLPYGHEDFKRQLWSWDGTIFRSGKDPYKCISLQNGNTGDNTPLVLNDIVGRDSPCRSNQTWFKEGRLIVSRKNTSMSWSFWNGRVNNNNGAVLYQKKNDQDSVFKLVSIEEVAELGVWNQPSNKM